MGGLGDTATSFFEELQTVLQGIALAAAAVSFLTLGLIYILSTWTPVAQYKAKHPDMMQNVIIGLVMILSAPPTVMPTRTPLPSGVVTLAITVAYDANASGGADIDEGVRGISVRVVSETSGTLPGAQVFVSEVGGVSGSWYTSAEAALAAGVTLDPDVLDIVELAPNQSVQLTLTAFTPVGEIGAIGWLLDPYSGGAGGGVVGGNTAVWRTEIDPNGCEGNVGELIDLPTPVGPAATPTASVTPWVPPYAGATRAP